MQYTNKRFKETFRISRNTFRYISLETRVNIEKQHTAEEPVSPQISLTICLYKLSHGDYNYTVSEMTRIGESIAICIVNEGFQAIIENL